MGTPSKQAIKKGKEATRGQLQRLFNEFSSLTQGAWIKAGAMNFFVDIRKADCTTKNVIIQDSGESFPISDGEKFIELSIPEVIIPKGQIITPELKPPYHQNKRLIYLPLINQMISQGPPQTQASIKELHIDIEDTAGTPVGETTARLWKVSCPIEKRYVNPILAVLAGLNLAPKDTVTNSFIGKVKTHIEDQKMLHPLEEHPLIKQLEAQQVANKLPQKVQDFFINDITQTNDFKKFGKSRIKQIAEYKKSYRFLDYLPQGSVPYPDLLNRQTPALEDRYLLELDHTFDYGRSFYINFRGVTDIKAAQHFYCGRIKFTVIAQDAFMPESWKRLNDEYASINKSNNSGLPEYSGSYCMAASDRYASRVIDNNLQYFRGVDSEKHERLRPIRFATENGKKGSAKSRGEQLDKQGHVSIVRHIRHQSFALNSFGKLSFISKRPKKIMGNKPETDDNKVFLASEVEKAFRDDIEGKAGYHVYYVSMSGSFHTMTLVINNINQGKPVFRFYDQDEVTKEAPFNKIEKTICKHSNENSKNYEIIFYKLQRKD